MLDDLLDQDMASIDDAFIRDCLIHNNPLTDKEEVRLKTIFEHYIGYGFEGETYGKQREDDT